MTRETQHVYAILNVDSGPKQGKDFSLKNFAGNDGRDMDYRQSDNSDLYSHGCSDSGTAMMVKEKEPQSQREAVIRPQQAGKIDFKSLYNRPKFTSDGIWSTGKGGPQSPNGKGRVKEKTKRSGKGDRNQHQLYRLSISNTRSNPTIGIAYPQQKVTPPKKLEVSDGPVSGSYRFHVPSIPEREAELQQEDLNFHRCFQKVSSSLTSTSTTSQAKAAPRQHHDLKLQQHSVSDHEGSSTKGQHHYLEFQDNGTDSWHSPEKNFTCSQYGSTVQKTCPFPEGNKSGSNGFGSLPYQYPFQPMHKSSPVLFANDSVSQDYLDAALAGNPRVPGAFTFHSPPSKGLEKAASSACDNLLKDSSTCILPSQQTAFLQAQQASMVQRQPALPCYNGRNEHSTEHNGAILSSGAMTSCGAINQTISTFQDNQTISSANNFSLHSLNATVSNRPSASGDSLPSQRPPLRRTSPPNPLSQMHFQNKSYSSSSANNVIAEPVACENSLLATGQREAHLWDAESNAYVNVGQNAAPYPALPGNQFTYQGPSSIEQRLVLTNPRIPWQQVNHMTALANDKRAEQARQPANAEPTLTQEDSELKGTNHALNNFAQNKPSGCHSSELMVCDEIASRRNGSVAQNCGASNNSYYHDGGKDQGTPLGDHRNNKRFFAVNQQVLTTSLRAQLGQSIVLPLSVLAESSPGESPMSSPVPNTLSSSTCSSLSPMSCSPVNPSSEESQPPLALTPRPFFNQSCQPKENKMFSSPSTLHSSSLQYHNSDHSKAFCFPQEITKDDQVSKYIHESQFHKQNTKTSNVCVNNFEIEPPPPPYSSHHLLTNSLSTANLDQLDVLLTCKQCDQNYSNLSSFLEHRQYCGVRAVVQPEMKDTLRGPEGKKVAMNSLKPGLSIEGLPLLKGLSDVHEHMHGSNTCADFLFNGESKGDTTDEPLKGNLFHGLTTSALSVHASDLEMDEAKLDSLITEALNEIDSSFMDVFVDEELSMIKAQPCNVKYSSNSESTENAKEFSEPPTYCSRNIFCLEKDTRQEYTENNRMSGRRYGEKKGVATKFIDWGSRHVQQTGAEDQSKGKISANALCPDKESDQRAKQKPDEKPSDLLQVSVTANRSKMSDVAKVQPNRKSIDSYEKHQVRPNPADLCITEEKNKCPRTPMRDKKKNSRNGTWSKELIHKIVQQKNKLHKLHIKNEKNTQGSLVRESSQTTKPILSYGEFDYVSESDDDVEYMKKHTRNKPTERLKYTFTSENLGAAERSKETAWKCRKTKEFLNFSRDSDSEVVSKDLSPVSSRRRSSRSSSSSVSSEVDHSKEVPDSSNEKEAEDRRSVSQRSHHGTFLEIQPTIDPLKEAHAHQIEFAAAKGTKRFASTKFLLTTSKGQQGNANVIQTNTVNEELLLPVQGKQLTQTSTACKSPEVLICKEKTPHEQQISTNKKSEYQPTSTVLSQKNSHQFSGYSESSLDFHMEEVNHLLHIDSKSNTVVPVHCTDVDMACSSLCDNPKDYGYYNRGRHSMDCDFTDKDNSSSDKNSDSYEQKDISSNYSTHPLQFSAISTSELHSAYTYTKNVLTSSFEHGSPDIASTTEEHTHEKVPSPPSFHSSSFFGELSLPGFERPLYADVPLSKENCASYPCSDNESNKSALFEQEYRTFLPEKDWTIMHEITPLLSEENFCNSLDEKHHNIGIALPNQISAETTSGCNVPFMNNMSVDELEIKRLVTELESHLQTSIPSSHVLSQANSEPQVSKECEGPRQYSTLPLDSVSENEKSLFLLDELNNLSNAHQVQAEAFVGVNLEDEPIRHPTLEQCYETPRSSWSYNIPFDSLEKTSLPLVPKTSDLADPYCSKVDDSQFVESMQDLPVTQSDSPTVTSFDFFNAQHDNSLPCLSAEEHTLINNSTTVPEITASLSLLPQDTEEPHSKKEDTVKTLPSQRTVKDLHEPNRIDKTFDDPPKLERFETCAPTFQLEFEMQDESVPILNVASTSQQCISNSGEIMSSKIHEPAQGPTVSATDDDRTSMGEKALDDSSLITLQPLHVKSDESKCLRLDMSKEEVVDDDDDEAGGAVLGQNSTVNPLQDLQLFVARTAKNNEEEMLMPCLPGLLYTALPSSSTFTDEQGDCEKNGSPASEIAWESTASHQGIESSAIATDFAAEQEYTPFVPEFTKECKKPSSTRSQSAIESESCSASSFTSSKSKLQICEQQQPNLGDECLELCDTNITADAISKNHDNILSFRDATLHPLEEEVKKEHQTGNLQEADVNQAAVTFDKSSQSFYPSPVSLETEAVDSFLKPAMLVHEATVRQPCDNFCVDDQLSSSLHLDDHSTPTDLNIHDTEKWEHCQTQAPMEPDFSMDPSHHQANDILYPTLNEMPENDAVRLSEILNTSFCKEDSSSSLPLLNKSFTNCKELTKSHPENHSYQLQLPEKSVCSQKAITDSELLSPLAHTTLEEGHGHEICLFPLTPPEHSATEECMGSSHCNKDSLADKILSNIDHSEQHVLVRSHCKSVQLENSQFHMNNIAQSFLPSPNQNISSELLPGCESSEPKVHHVTEHGACPSTDLDPHSQLASVESKTVCNTSIEGMGHSTLPADLFAAINDRKGETIAHLAAEMKHKNYFTHHEEHKNNLQEALNGVASTGVFARTDPMCPLNVNNFVLAAPRIVEAVGSKGNEASGDTGNCAKGDISETCTSDYMDPVMSGVLNILNCEKSKALFSSLSLPSSSVEPKHKKATVALTCDICPASFRSKAGLTRHKAAKHQAKQEGAKLVTVVDSGGVIPKKVCKTLKANNSKAPTSLPERNSTLGLPEEDPTQKVEEESIVLWEKSNAAEKATQRLLSSDIPNEIPPSNSPVCEQGEMFDLIKEKLAPKQPQKEVEKVVKKQLKDTESNGNSKNITHGNVCKRKAKTHISNSSESQVPSDEILNIIKTNILKAIACPGQSSSIITSNDRRRGRERQPSHISREAVGDKHRSDHVPNAIAPKMVSKVPVFDTTEDGHEKTKDSTAGASHLADQGWIDGYLRHVEQNGNDESVMGHPSGVNVEDKEQQYSGAVEGDMISHEESLNFGSSSPAETHRTLQLIEAELEILRDASESRFDSNSFTANSNTGGGRLTDSKNACDPDLSSLFDDDVTFSLLFPRDDHFVRRKCTRVYGKRNKNLAPAVSATLRETDSAGVFDNQPGHSFTSENSTCDGSRDVPSITLNDSLMLDVSHRSKLGEMDADFSSCENAMLHLDYQRPSPETEVIDMDNDTLLTFLCQNQELNNAAHVHEPSSLNERLEKDRGGFLTREMHLRSSVETDNEHLFLECNPDALNSGNDFSNKKGSSQSDFKIPDVELLNTKPLKEESDFENVLEDTEQDFKINTCDPTEKPTQRHKRSKSQTDDNKTTKDCLDKNPKRKQYKHYKCRACFQRFRTIGEFHIHKFSHHPFPPPTCYMCVQRKFTSREQLKDHLKDKHAKNKAGFWICGMCLKEISDVWMYNEHLREHATQFARKGQAQSGLGLHGCFADEAAVHSFLTRFVYRKPNDSVKHTEPVNNIKIIDSDESVEVEATAHENLELSGTQNKPTSQSSVKDSNTPEHRLQKEIMHTNPSNHLHVSETSSPVPESVQRSDAGQKNVPIHPQCKDPSRDCHHCGKQFPKPFKLQRHLVVHSLQKLFLCHKCPMFYQDVQELRSHLRQQHDILEESEIKHTTLYTCEMCADVMHVIKKSFICSTCNYTFSKKEQFERHMEKHLVGGIKTFKFRRVMRPGSSGTEARRKFREDEPSDCPPPSKRRTMPGLSPIHELPTTSPTNNNSSDFPPFGKNSPAPQTFFVDEGSHLNTGMLDTSVKMEGEGEEGGETLPILEEAQPYLSSLPPCLSPPMPRDMKRDPEIDDIPTLTISEPNNVEFDAKPPVPLPETVEVKRESTKGTLIDELAEKELPKLCTEQPAHTEGEKTFSLENECEKFEILEEKAILKEHEKESTSQSPTIKNASLTEFSFHLSEANKLQNSFCKNMNVNVVAHEDVLRPMSVEVPPVPVPLKEKVELSQSKKTSKDLVCTRKSSSDPHSSSRQSLNGQCISSNVEPAKSCSSKEKATPDSTNSAKEGNAVYMKEAVGNHQRTPHFSLASPFVVNPVRHSNSDPVRPFEKPSFNNPLKTYPKKRKDNLTLSYKSSSNSRENMPGQVKKIANKVRVSPARNEHHERLKKHERSRGRPTQPRGKEEALTKSFHGNKPKTVVSESQIKKTVLDPNYQKKVDGRRHSTGEHKHKKDVLGRMLHPIIPKASGQPLSSSLHKHKNAQGYVKPTDCLNHRTAESQNNILSKLFGQKLTSFKIPLRRDISE